MMDLSAAAQASREQRLAELQARAASASDFALPSSGANWLKRPVYDILYREQPHDHTTE